MAPFVDGEFQSRVAGCASRLLTDARSVTSGYRENQLCLERFLKWSLISKELRLVVATLYEGIAHKRMPSFLVLLLVALPSLDKHIKTCLHPIIQRKYAH